MSLITTDQVLLDLDSTTRQDATTRLAHTLADSGRCTDVDVFLADVREREAKMATGLPGGIAIPHARSAAITEPSLAFARSGGGIEWGAKDGPAHLIFLIAAPADGGEAHMQMLPKLAKALMNKDFRARLESATSDQEVVDLVNDHVSLDDAPPADTAVTPAPASAPTPEAPASLTLVGVTSCPTGIAHTYMAAEALENAAREAGHTMTVETQGSAGLTRLTPEQIAAADAVIFAHDVEVRERDRFAGKPLIDVGVKKAISDGPALIDEAAALAAQWQADPSKAVAAAAAVSGSSMVTKVDDNAGWGTRIRQILMTGVSYMIPFVAAGGIMIAIGFMIAQFAGGKTGAIDVTKYYTLDPTSTAQGVTILQNGFNFTNGMHWAALFFLIGAAAFGFLVPILSGFIAFAIADRPGLVPGIVGGAVASTMHAGFLGGIVTGFLGGYLAKWVASWKVPKGVRGVMPVVVIPLVSTFISLALFVIVLGRPIKWLTDELNRGLTNMTGASALILGLILGAMMGFDLGGPVNKVAYTFATTGLAAAGTATNAPQLKIMAAVMAAGMVAPLGMALATTVRPGLFSEPEKENGKAAWLLGFSFISEGAIPFAAADPWRVILSSVVGSAVTGALTMQFGATLRAPHGGIWVLPLIGNFLLFLLALVIGVLITTALVVILKSGDRSRQQVDAAATV